MHIHALRIKNFRRLKDVHIDLDRDISIFVGGNNSGKTATAHILRLFTGGTRDRFSIHDFNTDCWTAMDDFGDQKVGAQLPRIVLDLWFKVEAADLHRVVDLLPSLDWAGTLVGLRVELAASNEEALLVRFREARARAQEGIRPRHDGGADYHPWPKTLREFLTERLRSEFELRYYVLDRAMFDDSFNEEACYQPLLIKGEGRGGKEVLNSLLRVDFLDAQRHLSDSAEGTRAEDLSRCLSRFYDRNLEKRADDYDAMQALADSEAMLNEHLARVFEPTLLRLAALGYPGVSNPRLVIKSSLNPATIMSSNDGARVHYALGEPAEGVDPLTLPDRYNGLGFKNLIYMVVELLDRHGQWLDIEENRPPLHLIFVEEPEAHLHTQLQQVFIQKVLDILGVDGPDAALCHSQLIVTTHSPHILYERGFQPVRYFRRQSSGNSQSTTVLNLSAFYEQTEAASRDFLQRYMKLTHSDLFFADAAILVEGNVERLTCPLMIEKAAPRLRSAYLSILEVGGAFAHRFRSLIEFLGIQTLVITDLDSVIGRAPVAEVDAAGATAAEPESDDEGQAAGTACMTDVDGAVTSNQTLVQWLSGLSAISDLFAAPADKRTQASDVDGNPLVRVAYQTQVDVSWGDASERLAGRTLEEAFAFENLAWTQDEERAELGLRVKKGAQLDVAQLAERIHKRVKNSSFRKTDFALALLAADEDGWTVPTYIADGLHWLEDIVIPAEVAANATKATAEVPL